MKEFLLNGGRNSLFVYSAVAMMRRRKNLWTTLLKTMLGIKNKSIGVGDKVLVAINNRIEELEIVDVPGDPKAGKISWLSPIAQALLGRRPYPTLVKVKLPNGKTLDCSLMRVSHQ